MTDNQLDIYHRGFKALEGEIENSDIAKKVEKAIQKSEKSKEFMDAVRYRCVIKTDWIEKIEHTIPYLEEAINQNRQFILQTGETVLIEKAKRISRASVEHLAHHSELITREPEDGGDLIPEKIYMAENINNYAVYENKFLYMLLCFANDFVSTRYTKISELWNKFHSEFSLQKEITIGKRKISYSATMSEDSTNDQTTSYDKETLARISRIRAIQQSLSALLQTPLMKEVSHSPMIKPPITRTNVLRMDNSFRNAVELFDFLYDYEGAGYIQQEFHQSYTSFPENVGKSFSAIIALSSYLTYRHGGKLEEAMEEEYQSYKRLEKELREIENKKRIEKLRESLMNKEITAQEYIFALEDRILGLEDEICNKNDKDNELADCKSELARLKENEDILKSDIASLHDKLVSEQQRMKSELHAQETRIYQLEQDEKETALKHKSELEAIIAEYTKKLDCETKERQKLSEEYDFCRARLHGIRQEHGLITSEDDFSSKEGFAELERESMAFKKFFDNQWKNAKKQIRREIKEELKQSSTKNKEPHN